VNSFLDNFEFEPAEGRLGLQGVRYLLMRPSILVELQKALESQLPYDAPAILTGAAQAEGVAVAGRLKEVFAYSEAEVVSTLLFHLQQGGWGALSAEMINTETREVVVRGEGSPFAEGYGPSIGPVCHLLLGVLNGMAIALFESEVEGLEVQCQAKGDQACRFVVSARPG
jgi:predicted hydrocarbon binding protein